MPVTSATKLKRIVFSSLVSITPRVLSVQNQLKPARYAGTRFRIS